MQNQKINTPWLSADLVGLEGHPLKQRLLEKMANSEDALKRFWDKVQIKGPDDCWEWLASTNTDGYGQFAFYPEKKNKKVNLQAHQIAYFLQHRCIPDGLCVCHTCDNRKCNNHQHLFIGTQTDNIKDRDNKGRHRATKGIESASAILTEIQVQEIRILRFVGKRTLSNIAATFGITDSCVKGIIYGSNWKHLPIPLECF